MTRSKPSPLLEVSELLRPDAIHLLRRQKMERNRLAEPVPQTWRLGDVLEPCRKRVPLDRLLHSSFWEWHVRMSAKAIQKSTVLGQR